MPIKSRSMFRYKQSNPSNSGITQVSNFSKTPALLNVYRNERCPTDCNNTYQVKDVIGNVDTCSKVIGGSTKCIPLSGNTMINANVPTKPDGNPTKKYYTSNIEYMRARCRTYAQKQFNYVRDGGVTEANCCGNDAGYVSGSCKSVTYKPNNKPFSVQGAVSSSARLLQLKYNTVTRPPSGTKYPPATVINHNRVKSSLCSAYHKKNNKNTC